MHKPLIHSALQLPRMFIHTSYRVHPHPGAPQVFTCGRGWCGGVEGRNLSQCQLHTFTTPVFSEGLLEFALRIVTVVSGTHARFQVAIPCWEPLSVLRLHVVKSISSDSTLLNARSLALTLLGNYRNGDQYVIQCFFRVSPIAKEWLCLPA